MKCSAFCVWVWQFVIVFYNLSLYKLAKLLEDLLAFIFSLTHGREKKIIVSFRICFQFADRYKTIDLKFVWPFYLQWIVSRIQGG